MRGSNDVDSLPMLAHAAHVLGRTEEASSLDLKSTHASRNANRSPVD